MPEYLVKYKLVQSKNSDNTIDISDRIDNAVNKLIYDAQHEMSRRDHWREYNEFVLDNDLVTSGNPFDLKKIKHYCFLFLNSYYNTIISIGNDKLSLEDVNTIDGLKLRVNTFIYNIFLNSDAHIVNLLCGNVFNNYRPTGIGLRLLDDSYLDQFKTAFIDSGIITEWPTYLDTQYINKEPEKTYIMPRRFSYSFLRLFGEMIYNSDEPYKIRALESMLNQCSIEERFKLYYYFPTYIKNDLDTNSLACGFHYSGDALFDSLEKHKELLKLTCLKTKKSRSTYKKLYNILNNYYSSKESISELIDNCNSDLRSFVITISSRLYKDRSYFDPEIYIKEIVTKNYKRFCNDVDSCNSLTSEDKFEWKVRVYNEWRNYMIDNNLFLTQPFIFKPRTFFKSYSDTLHQEKLKEHLDKLKKLHPPILNYTI